MLKYKIASFSNLGLLVILLSLSSCLKERVGNFNTGNAPAHIIDFKNTGANMAGPSSFYPGFMGDVGSVDPGQSGYFYVNLQYAGSGNTSQDIAVNLGIDQTVLDRYNKENSTSYVLPPTDVYSIPSKVTIKAGTNVITDSVKINRAADYDFNKTYALPIKITSVSTGDAIAANYGAAIFRITVRNAYDGVYSVTSGTITRYTSPTTPANDALSGSMAGNPDVTLTTVGAYTVEIGNLQWASKGGGVGGIDHLQATIDPVTNKVTMKCAVASTTLANIAGAVNSYDPATKTFTLNFDWNQNANKREVKNLVIKYAGPR